MTQSNISLSLFEEQLLLVLARHIEAGGAGYMQGFHIRMMGKTQFGPGWGGASQDRKDVNSFLHKRTYPKINFALGRLAKQGLVKRTSWERIEEMGYTAGNWGLTDQGKILMGLPS